MLIHHIKLFVFRVLALLGYHGTSQAEYAGRVAKMRQRYAQAGNQAPGANLTRDGHGYRMVIAAMTPKVVIYG